MSGCNIVEKLLTIEVGTDALDSICDQITKEIVLKNQTLLSLIEQLESLLTHTDLNKRTLGLSTVGHVTQSLPRDFLSTTELEYLVAFFCSQVNNHHSLLPAALSALNGLVQFSSLSTSSLHKITYTLFNSVTWQTQVQADRRNFYNILHFIIFNRLEEYKSISSETIFNVISAVDGERDPRNLLLIFSFLPKLFSTLPLGSLVDEAFEVTSCYFPIDFHQSSTDPGPVTKEDLVSALIPCLLAVPEDFSTPCIALIQEKLNSTLKSAKIDSYNLLILGCEVWPRDVLGNHAEALWVDIKRDTLPPRDTHVAELATKALQALVKSVPEEKLSELLTSVIRSCEIFLSDVQLSLFEPASCLLLSVMEASIPACRIVVARLLPGFLALLHVTKGTHQNLILRKIGTFTQICLKQNIGFEASGDWAALWAEVISCISGLDTKQTGYEALKGVANHLTSELRFRLYVAILTHIVESSDCQVRSSAIKCLQEIAVIYEEEVQLNVIDKMFASENPEDELTKDINKLEAIVSVAAAVQRFHQVAEVHFTRLISKGSSYITKAIALLKDLMDNETIDSDNTFISFIFGQSTIIPTLINLDTNEQDLLNSAKIIQTLVRMQSPSEQKKTVQRFGKEISLDVSNITKKMVMLEALMGALWPEAVATTVEEVIETTFPIAMDSSANPLARTSALRLIASYVNKANDDKMLEVITERMSLYDPQVFAEAHAYVTAALVLRGHPLSGRWIDKLVEMLDADENVAQTATEGFKQIMEKAPQYLNDKNHCVVRLLYRQRLFHTVVPRLVGSAKRVYHLKALATLLQSVPHTVYSPYIKQMIPLLVKSLDSDSDDLLITTLRTLADLLLCSSTLLEEHVDMFVRRFLLISTENKSMHIRIAAVQCLCNTLKFSPVLLMPYKTQVVYGLVPCLDDKKRLVRQEAAWCRSKWFLLGSPSTDS